jgi:hypothetical protein
MKSSSITPKPLSLMKHATITDENTMPDQPHIRVNRDALFAAIDKWLGKSSSCYDFEVAALPRSQVLAIVGCEVGQRWTVE